VRGNCERIDVESDQASAGLQLFQDRLRMPAAAERAVNRDLAGHRSKAAEHFIDHDRSMHAAGRLAGGKNLHVQWYARRFGAFTLPSGLEMKSTVEEIRARFDKDVERFSNLTQGSPPTSTRRWRLELIAEAAAATTPRAQAVARCRLRRRQLFAQAAAGPAGARRDLVDLSAPMLARAEQRTTAAGARSVRLVQGDIRDVVIGEAASDVIVAAAVFHHLRTDAEWRDVFAKTVPRSDAGGSCGSLDVVECEVPAMRAALAALRRLSECSAGRRIATRCWRRRERRPPRPLTYQLDLLRGGGLLGR
jgi:tRNA (cmo5U34)-methyltransferase